MSSPTIVLTNYPLTAETLRELPLCSEAEQALLQRGFCFEVTRRIDLRLWARWKRKAYVYFCREARPELRVPPVGPIWRGIITSFIIADSKCTHPDDQLHILPLNWTYSGDKLHPDVVCRPRDEEDGENYERLKRLFGMPSTECGNLEEQLWIAQEYIGELETTLREATALLQRTLKSTDDG